MVRYSKAESVVVLGKALDVMEGSEQDRDLTRIGKGTRGYEAGEGNSNSPLDTSRLGCLDGLLWRRLSWKRTGQKSAASGFEHTI